jgi:integrase-like protein
MSTEIPYLKPTAKGTYRYQRRVPKTAQDVVGKKAWDLSLGTDYLSAVDKARAYAGVHDELIGRVASPSEKQTYVKEQAEEGEAMALRIHAYGGFKDDPRPPFDANPGTWKNTSDKMKQARTLPRSGELKELAYFAAYAFGDRSALDRIERKSELGEAMVDVMEPSRPADPVDAVMYDALKTALDARILEIGGAVLVNHAHTLNGLHARIAKLRNSKPATVANHKVTSDKLNKFLREVKGYDHEPSIASLTPELLQEYRDHLLDDPNIGNGSVHKYFDGLKSVFRYAMKEQKVPGLLANPVDAIEMPKAAPIEDSMYLPFSRAEIRQIWEVAQEVWSPDNTKSHFSAGRRKAFLMGLRVLLWSGLRPTEFFWLRDHGEVTTNHMYITRTKTGVKRYIPICDHISDFPAFVQDGGFEDCVFVGKHRGEIYGEYNAEKLKEAMRRSFSDIRKLAKVTDRRKVLYSTKDTLLQRLRSVEGYSTYLEVCVTGHVKKLEKGRHYGGVLGEDPAMQAKVKAALDSVTYW